MSEAKKKKGGRPKKVVETNAAPATPETPTVDTNAELLARIQLLEKALLQKSAENEALKAAGRAGAGDRVVLENTGMVQVVIPVEGEPDLVLDVKGVRRTGSVPLHVYTRLKRDTKLFEKGYIIRADEPVTNPNVILDVEEWVENLNEREISSVVNKITSEGTLHRIWNYLDTVESPTGKHLLLRKAVTVRTKELFDYDLVEDESGE